MSEDGEDLLVPSIITDTLFLYKNSHSWNFLSGEHLRDKIVLCPFIIIGRTLPKTTKWRQSMKGSEQQLLHALPLRGERHQVLISH
jgi:hypothetical protein